MSLKVVGKKGWVSKIMFYEQQSTRYSGNCKHCADTGNRQSKRWASAGNLSNTACLAMPKCSG